MAPFEKINIPQKPPMVMVDRIVGIADKTTITSFVIRPDNIFCENGCFREPGMIENMAQSAAAGAGAKPGIKQGEAPIGFIGGIKNLKIIDFPKVGDEISTTVTVTHEIFDATIVQAEITLYDRLIASCELKIFLISN
jgi:predicted hotdog family 3-hydroxylacyl-ACP dehydratase